MQKAFSTTNRKQLTMTNTFSTSNPSANTDASGSTDHRGLLEPPIPLKRPEQKTLHKDEHAAHKPLVNLDGAGSAKCDLTTAFFEHGAPKQWITMMHSLRTAMTGLGASTRPAKCRTVRKALKGKALLSFDAAADGNSETADHFNDAPKAVTKSMLPPDSARLQKRWMWCNMRKSRDVSVREHVSHVEEINGWSKEFPPPEGSQAPIDPLPPDELCDDLDHGNPSSWQKTMTLQGFDPLANSADEFIAFCERIESAEGSDFKQVKPNKNKRKGGSNAANASQDKPQGAKGKRTCVLHGEDNRTAEQRKPLKAQAECMKATCNAQTHQGKKDHRAKQGANAMIATAVDVVIKKDRCDTRKAVHAATLNVEHLTLSSNEAASEESA